ncbi:MAG: hypothetical protein U0175_13950 [Caldilineaceae bacterium]
MPPTRELILYQSLAELLASNRHLYEASKWQVEKISARQGNDVAELFSRIKQLAKVNCLELEAHLETFAVERPFIATRASRSTPYAKRFCDSPCSPLSRMLHDDYVALSSMTVEYTMLHTQGMALHDADSAVLALHHLKALTPLLNQIIKIIPQLVTQELSVEAVEADAAVAGQATLNTQKAWLPSHLLGKGNLSLATSQQTLM